MYWQGKECVHFLWFVFLNEFASVYEKRTAVCISTCVYFAAYCVQLGAVKLFL